MNYNIMDENNNQEFLIDKFFTGREKPWRDKAIARDFLSKIYFLIDVNKSQRLKNCASVLRYDILPDGRKKLSKAFFCRVRLCPMCIWRRSLKVYSQVNKIMNFLRNDYEFIFLTLTIKNCKPEELQKTIDKFMYAWCLFVKMKFFKNSIKGYYRAFELTHNLNKDKKEYDTYHPHFHCVFAVDKNYFKSKDYISFELWQKYWKKVMKIKYEPKVYIKKIYGDLADSVAEVAKYSVTQKSYIIYDEEIMTLKTVKLLDKVLNKRRFVSLGGVFKEIHRKLELDDMEKGDLVNFAQTSLTPPKIDEIEYFWHVGYRQYIRQK